MAPLLSILSGTLEDLISRRLSSVRRFISQIASLVASIAAKYFTSQEDDTAVFCRRDNQSIGPPAKRNM